MTYFLNALLGYHILVQNKISLKKNHGQSFKMITIKLSFVYMGNFIKIPPFPTGTTKAQESYKISTTKKIIKEKTNQFKKVTINTQHSRYSTT